MRLRLSALPLGATGALLRVLPAQGSAMGCRASLTAPGTAAKLLRFASLSTHFGSCPASIWFGNAVNHLM